MSTLTTYERYKQALEQIADGAADAQAIALAALTPLKPEPTYEWKLQAEARKENADHNRSERNKVAKAAYLDWLKAGRPPIMKFGRTRGLTRSAMFRLLQRGERAMGVPWGEQRLGHTYRNKNYDTAKEIFERKEKPVWMK